MKTVLLSMGNDLRRDDGIAAALCRALPQPILNRVHYADLGVFGQDLASYIKDANCVIIVDAVLDPTRVGELLTFQQLEFTSIWPTQTHGFSWLSALKLMPEHPPVTFVGIPIVDMGWGSGFSDQVEEHFADLTNQLAAVCERKLEAAYA